MVLLFFDSSDRQQQVDVRCAVSGAGPVGRGCKDSRENAGVCLLQTPNPPPGAGSNLLRTTCSAHKKPLSLCASHVLVKMSTEGEKHILSSP